MIYRKTPSFVYVTFFFFASFSLLAQGVQVEKRLGTTPAGFGYLEYLPPDYPGSTKKFPTIIFLHGTGEKGNGTTDLAKVAANGPPKLIKAGQWPVKSPITGLYPAENFIVISPQSTNGFPTAASVRDFITYLITTYRVDPDRIYLTGLSAGGVSIFTYIKTYVDQVAAVIPISGNGMFTVSKACFFKDIPMWAFHGDQDGTTDVTNSTGIVAAMNNCVPPPVPKAKVTVYNGVGHDGWSRTYNLTGMSGFDPTYDPFSISIYDWLLLFKRRGTAPTANAGADKTLTLPTNTITIPGASTPGTGTITSYAWTKVSGPSATIQNGTTATVTLQNLLAGNYTFRFTVTNSSGLQASDDVVVKVLAANVAPTANAGADKTLTLPTNTITIPGASTPGTGTITSYAWTKVSGPSATIQNGTTATVTLQNLLAGNYTFRFTVTNSSGLQASDDVVVKVLAANVAPTANAGVDKVLTLPTSSVILTGSGSDSDGTIASYVWTQVSGGAFTWSGASTSTLTLSLLKAGVYEFRLTVTDDKGAIGFDDVKITVNAAAGGVPVANAGLDKLVKLPSSSVTIVGVGTDTDGTITSYQWTKVSGPAVTLTNATTARLKVSNLVSGVAVFRLKVTDNSGATGEDDVTVKFNYPPAANAGADQIVTLVPELVVTVPGIGMDTDGTIQSYGWSKASGPTVTLGGNKTSTLSLSNLNEGTYEFKLTVVDNMGSSASDNVTVTVEGLQGLTADVTTEASSSANSTLFNAEDGTSAIIYDELGKKVFEGEWSSDLSTQVIVPNKIHYYKLYKDGHKIGSGKVVIVP